MKKHKAKKHTKKNKGFSLIELLIVVAIILIIAAIAIPNLLRSRIAANEASAVGSVRTMVTAEITYNTSYQAYGTQAQLGGTAAVCATPSAANACLIDNQLATATTAATAKSGYFFSIPAAVLPTDFVIEAQPANPGTTGVREFCAWTDGVVRGNPTVTPVTTIALCQGYNAL